MNLTPQLVLASIAAHPELNGPRRFVVAFSGGLDSTVLLDLCRRALPRHPGATLLAVHVDHAMQEKSSDWEQHCAAVAEQLGVAFASRTVEVALDNGASPESAARQARYSALRSFVEPGDVLLTGHHQEDQLETVLLQLLRGSGVAGLAAMPQFAALGPGWHLRPLRSVGRSKLLEYTRATNLDWLDDPSNLDLRYDRNFLRHSVLPLLTQRWPAVAATTARTAQHCATAAHLLQELGATDVRSISHDGNSIDIDRLGLLSAERQQNAIRQWLSQENFALPGTAHLQQIMQLVACASATGCVTWADVEVRRYRERLYAMQSLPQSTNNYHHAIEQGVQVDLPNGFGQVTCCAVRGGLDPRHCNDTLTLRFRAGGEKLRPSGSKHRRELSKLFQEAGIVPWMRDRIPLLYAGERLAAVGDLWLEQDLVVAPEEQGLGLTWKMPLPLY